MLPKYHIFFGLIFSIIILFIFPQIGFIGFFIIFFSSFLIDIDHYLFYTFTKKDWSLRNAHKWFLEKRKIHQSIPNEERKKLPTIPCIFHGLEAMLVIAIFAFFFPILLFVLVGFAFHQSLDAANIIYSGHSLRHVSSQTLNIFKYLQIN